MSDQKLEMDRAKAFTKLKGMFSFGGLSKDGPDRAKAMSRVKWIVTTVVLLGVGFPAIKFIFNQGKMIASGGHGPSDVANAYSSAFKTATEKFYAIRKAEIENERLKLENSNLRLKLESVSFDCSAKSASTQTNNLELALSKETGAKVGRTLASIAYKPPGHLLPPQLHTLAVSYFRAGEYEKAAVNMTFLTGLDENDSFKHPKNYLMTGIAWYKLDNFELADHYFDKVLATSETPESIQWHAQARLWRALTAKRVGKGKDSQVWLRDLIDHHPHSTEAAWVNSAAAGSQQISYQEEEESPSREPAGETSGSTHHE